jgi:hypothetical protein
MLSNPAVLMPPNPAAEEAVATALMPLNSTIPVPPNSAAEESGAPITEAEVQEYIGDEADAELQQVHDEDSGFDVVNNVIANLHQQQCNECEVTGVECCSRQYSRASY